MIGYRPLPVPPTRTRKRTKKPSPQKISTFSAHRAATPAVDPKAISRQLKNSTEKLKDMSKKIQGAFPMKKECRNEVQKEQLDACVKRYEDAVKSIRRSVIELEKSLKGYSNEYPTYVRNLKPREHLDAMFGEAARLISCATAIYRYKSNVAGAAYGFEVCSRRIREEVSAMELFIVTMIKNRYESPLKRHWKNFVAYIKEPPLDYY